MNGILIAAACLGAMGLIFGAVLAVVGQKFAIPQDPKRDAVRDCLPGANCGGCGLAGCDACAEAIAKGEAKVTACPVGGEAVAAKIADIMGVSAEKQQKLVATVMCRGGLDRCKTRFEYDGPKDCKSAALAAGGDKSCRFSCLGFGDCEAHCPFGAIRVGADRLARVDEDKCHGCGVCVSACPRGVIKLLPAENRVHRTCSAMEKGKNVRDNCSAGCIGCGKCERSCKFGALKLVDNLPQIDMNLCVGCMSCADNCPTGALRSNEAFRRHALVDYTRCTGCGKCQETCLFGAIQSEAGGSKRTVIDWNCVGCGKCQEACPEHCIQMVLGAKYSK